MVVENIILSFSNISNALRLCDVKINWPFALSSNICSNSPNIYSNIPASNSSIARQIEGSLNAWINAFKIEIIFIIPSDSILIGNDGIPSLDDISSILCPSSPLSINWLPYSLISILNPGIIVYKTVLISSIIFLNIFKSSLSKIVVSKRDTGKSPFTPLFSLSILKAIGKTMFAEITPECTLLITNKSFTANSNNLFIIKEYCWNFPSYFLKKISLLFVPNI